MILACDLGGTKTVLAIYDGALALVRDATYPSAEHASLEAIVDQFFADHPGDRAGLAAACFGVAGPVVGGTAKITKLPWTIDAAALSRQLGGVPVSLLNDLQATALGTLVLPPAAFAVLQAGAAPAEPLPTIAVIAPGTGLGEALLVGDGARYRALASEGGHADFAPTTEDELGLFRFLSARHGDHVSYDRVLSGPGLGDLYDFARDQLGAPEPAWLTAELGHDRGAAISRAALAGSDAACVHALRLFVEILGAEAGNCALRGLATGGVVIGGGIPPKILAALQDGRLLARFVAKGRFAAWMRTLAVRVALEPRAALLGAAHHAASQAASHKDAP